MNFIKLLLPGLILAVLATSAACSPGLKGAIPTAPYIPENTARNAASNAAGDATKGKRLFSGTCASCHGPDAKGLPNLGKNLTTSTFAKGLSDGDLVKFVTRGRPASDPANTTGVDMPPRGGNPALKDADLHDIVAFIRTLQK